MQTCRDFPAAGTCRVSRRKCPGSNAALGWNADSRLRQEAACLNGFPSSLSMIWNLGAEIHVELDRMRRLFETMDLFPFEFHVAVDLIVVEHTSLRQEGAVRVEVFDRFAK